MRRDGVLTDPSLLSLEHMKGGNKGRRRERRESGVGGSGGGWLQSERRHHGAPAKGVKTHINLHGYT